jgi:hypothetical protein
MLLASIFDRMHGDELIPIIAIVAGCAVGAIAIIASAWRKARETSALSELKRDLIAQGRPTDEIERICNAGVPKNCG